MMGLVNKIVPTERSQKYAEDVLMSKDLSF